MCVCLGKDEVRMQLDSALQDVNTRYTELEETEKKAVCRALVEERGRFCSFVTMLKPVLVSSSLSRSLTHSYNSTHFSKAIKNHCNVLQCNACVLLIRRYLVFLFFLSERKRLQW